MELITVHQADLAFTVLAVLGLVCGAVAALLTRRGGGNAIASALLYGGPLVLMGALWPAHKAISAGLGAGTVKNLLINLILFLVVGGVIGAIWAWLIPAPSKIEGTATSGDADTASV